MANLAHEVARPHPSVSRNQIEAGEAGIRAFRHGYADDVGQHELELEGWDALLEIFIHEAHGRRVSLEQLSADNRSPPLVSHRSVNMLIDKRLVDRGYNDPDLREVSLSLTPANKQKMARSCSNPRVSPARRCSPA